MDCQTVGANNCSSCDARHHLVADTASDTVSCVIDAIEAVPSSTELLNSRRSGTYTGATAFDTWTWTSTAPVRGVPAQQYWFKGVRSTTDHGGGGFQHIMREECKKSTVKTIIAERSYL